MRSRREIEVMFISKFLFIKPLEEELSKMDRPAYLSKNYQSLLKGKGEKIVASMKR